MNPCPTIEEAVSLILDFLDMRIVERDNKWKLMPIRCGTCKKDIRPDKCDRRILESRITACEEWE